METEISLKSLIHSTVMKEERKPYRGIHPSSLGGCPRTHYWKIKGILPTTPPGIGELMNFKMGDAWENALFPILQRLDGIKVHHHKGEKAWSVPELNLFGTPDYTITVDGKNLIVDAKTVKSKWFDYVEREYKTVQDTVDKNTFLLEKNHHYAIQQGAYLLMAKRLGLEYDHAKLIFVSKDNSFIGWEVEIYLTEELEKEILERIEYLNNCLNFDKLPKCECEDWKVGYCDFGVVETQTENRTHKMVNTECCNEEYVINYNKILKGEN